jgi:hypothetical protein
MNRVLINGDDILFCGPRKEFDLLAEYGAMVGLSLSVGKAYVHHAYANVNSTSIVRNLRESTTPKEIPYLNTGLYFGQHKVLSKTGEGEGEEDRTHFCDVIDRIMDGCLAGRQKEILGSYLKLHSDKIVRECNGRNLFIARSLGGMGVRCPVGWRYEVTRVQLQQVLRIIGQKRTQVVENIQPYQFRTIPLFESEKIISPWRALEAPQTGLEVLPGSHREAHKADRWLIEKDEIEYSLLELGIVELVSGEVRVVCESNIEDWSDDFNAVVVKTARELDYLDWRMKAGFVEDEPAALII